MSTDTYIDFHTGPDAGSTSPDYVRIGYLHNFVCESQWLSGVKEVDEHGHEYPISVFGLFRTKWNGAQLTNETIRRIYRNAQKDQNNDFKNDILTTDEIRKELLNVLGHYIQFRVD
jgi:hypothetical protein